MKSYLLLCFFLLFYSINSQQKCGYVRERCLFSCRNNIVTSKECRISCERNYYKCLAHNAH